MLRSARRMAGSVSTDRFHWQMSAAAPTGPRLVPLAFAKSAEGSTTTVDAQGAAEARELHLPSVSQERLEAIEREAFDVGRARGEQVAEAELGRVLETAVSQLTATIDDVAALRTGIMRRAERELVQLAIAIADRVVRREIAIDPELLLVIARVAIDRLGEQAVAVVHLNPNDYEIVSRDRREHLGSIELTPDPALPRGGCVVRSAFGEIDAGIDAQIREIARELLGVENNEERLDGVGFSS